MSKCICGKKGQLGKIIPTPPVFIFIVVIMAIFLFLSAGISLIGSNVPEELIAKSFTSSKDDFLLKTVELEFADGFKSLPPEKVIVYDVFYFLWKEMNPPYKKIFFQEKSQVMGEIVKQTLDEKNNCLAIYFLPIADEWIAYKYGQSGEDSVLSNWFSKPGNREGITVKAVEIGSEKLIYYYGRCS